MIPELARRSSAMAALLFILSISHTFSDSGWNMTNSIGFGMQWGLTREIVYPTISKNLTNNKFLSLLNWDMKNIPIICMTSALSGKRKIGFDFGFHFSFPGIPTGNMHDYDWFFTDREWSHWSVQDIFLRWGLMFDGSAHWKIMESKRLALRIGVAYHLDSWAWSDWGKSNIYSYAPNTDDKTIPRPYDEASGDQYRTIINTIPQDNNVDYEIVFHSILAMFQMRLQNNTLFLTLTTRLGPALIYSTDFHKKRKASTGVIGLVFKNMGVGIPWIDGSLDLGINLTQNLSCTLRGNIAWMPETVSETTLTDSAGTLLSISSNSGGADLIRYGVSIFLSWKLFL